MKFQDNIYDIRDHNKCSSSEKSDEKCILRKSYFRLSGPRYAFFVYIPTYSCSIPFFLKISKINYNENCAISDIYRCCHLFEATCTLMSPAIRTFVYIFRGELATICLIRGFNQSGMVFVWFLANKLPVNIQFSCLKN